MVLVGNVFIQHEASYYPRDNLTVAVPRHSSYDMVTFPQGWLWENKKSFTPKAVRTPISHRSPLFTHYRPALLTVHS